MSSTVSQSDVPTVRPWWDGARDSGPVMSEQRKQRARVETAVGNVVDAVERVRSWIPSWRRVIIEVAAQAKAEPAALARAIDAAAQVRSSPTWSPPRAYGEFLARDAASAADGMTARQLVGEQAELLAVDLQVADNAWQQLLAFQGANPDATAVSAAAQRTLDALDASLQHALFLTFLADAKAQRVGSAMVFSEYCDGWELTTSQISTTWLWLTHDPLVFGGEQLPLVLDVPHQRVYRKAPSFSALWWITTVTPLWAAALAFGLIAGLFALLHQAGLTHWPGDWAVKLVILMLFISLGAVAHVASRQLSAISYDDPLQVYVAGQALDWLSLRWLAILRAYIPITFVLGTLWGAGTIPKSFQDLSTALLSGYSADSLFHAGISRLASQASASGTSKAPVAGSPAGAAPAGQGGPPGGQAASLRPSSPPPQ